MNIKLYEKVLELIGRDGFKLVGSKIKEIVGSKRSVGKFENRFKKASNFGVTRLEISFMFSNLPEYSFNQPSMKTLFGPNASNFIHEIIE